MKTGILLYCSHHSGNWAHGHDNISSVLTPTPLSEIIFEGFVYEKTIFKNKSAFLNICE